MFTLIKKYFHIFAFVAGLCAIFFAYGVVVGKFEVFPHDIMDSGYKAFEAYKQKRFLEKDTSWYRERNGKKNGVTVNNEGLAYNGYTFITLIRSTHFISILIDMDGNLLHTWDLPYSKVWPKAGHLLFQAPDSAIKIHGAHLFPNGDVVLSFDGGSLPEGGGLVKMDSASRLLWSLNRNTHHDVDVDEAGHIWTCAHKYRREYNPDFPFIIPPYYEDFVLEVSPSGKLLREISMLESIYKSGREGLLLANTANWAKIEKGDPADLLHLNNVEVLRRDIPGIAGARSGDLLVSYRNINTIAILDHASGRIGWSVTGLFQRQHDPDLLPNGNFMVFDNRKDDRQGRALGGSRILEFDPISQDIIWEYRGSGSHAFFTNIMGVQEVLPNGNVLVTESESGRIFEVTHDDAKTIVWEFINRINDTQVGVISQANRISKNDIHFKFN